MGGERHLNPRGCLRRGTGLRINLGRRGRSVWRCIGRKGIGRIGRER